MNDNAKTKLRAGPNVFSAEDYRTIAFPYGHTGTFDLIRRRKHELAAIIVDPARKGEASAAHVEWLHQLYKTCSESDVLLILDETITGFRVKYEGMQELFGLLPDLVTYGGVIGGGLSLGAVAGRADIIKSLHSPSADISGSLGNTHVGNTLSIAAGVATLGYLRNNRATLYPELNAQSEEWVKNFNAFVAREHMPVEMKNIGSMFRIFFRGNAAVNRKTAIDTPLTTTLAFNILTLNRCVMMHASHRGFLSLSHTQQDLKLALDVFKKSLCDMRDDGFFTA